jgi:tRNA pseudouridine55 synthase
VSAGLLVIDKPPGCTSHDVVNRVRRLAGTRKVGHAGTLDPMATGVLVLGVERATRLLTYLVGADKAYTATVRLGVSTVTDDAEGEVLERREAGGIGAEEVAAAVAGLRGNLDQVPSAVSAIKVEGRRAYARARAGEQVVLAARAVTVRRFVVLAARSGTDGGLGVLDLDVEVDCSSGTYVRALARDLGAALRLGGHLTALRRTRVGPYHLGTACTLEQLEARHEAGAPLGMLSMAAAAREAFPVRELSGEESRRLGHGQSLSAVGLGAGPVAAFAPDGALVALVSESGAQARPVLVLVG